jgi:hypothetical protein
MNIVGILSRVLRQVPLETAIEIIREKNPNWNPPKRPKKKSEIENDFYALQEFIGANEVEDFVQMAVMKRMIGLPAYTYNVKDLNFLNDKSDQILTEELKAENHAYGDVFTISITVNNINQERIELSFRIKEYEGSWKTGVRNTESLSAVFTANVTLDRVNRILTVYTGNHVVQDVIRSYLSSVSRWPIESYRLREFPNQQFGLGNASFKTSMLLDFVYNRLTDRGISSSFNEIKFNTGSRKADGIKSVTINGSDILTSQLGCEYITIGSAMIFFKLRNMYNDMSFSTMFFLKGSTYDVLKVVIFDIEDETKKQQIMEIIQGEYINMCKQGMLNVEDTKSHLNTIYDKYSKNDKLITTAIQQNTLNSLSAIADIVSILNDQDEKVIEGISNYIRFTQTVLDTIGYSGDDHNVKLLKEFVGYEEPTVVDPEDYGDEDDGLDE